MTDNGNSSGFLAELRERHVFKVSAIYAVVAWILVQVCGIVFESFDIPTSFLRGVIVLAVIGFPVVVVLSWIFDLTPKGIQRTSSRRATKGQPAPAGSIAVLPFLNLSDDPSQDHFVIGIYSPDSRTIQSSRSCHATLHSSTRIDQLMFVR